MSIECFLEGLRLGLGQKYSLSIRDVGFESLEDAEDLTEENIVHFGKANQRQGCADRDGKGQGRRAKEAASEG